MNSPTNRVASCDESSRRDGKELHGASAVYRKAILLALEALHDHQSRSNVDAVRRHTMSRLDDEDYPWNEILFMKTYKSVANSGDININANIMVELSPEFKRRRSDSINQRLQQEQYAMKPLLLNSDDADSNIMVNNVCTSSSLDQQQHLISPTITQGQNNAGQTATSSVAAHHHHDNKLEIPRRRSEHDKWKIMSKKLYDKVM